MSLLPPKGSPERTEIEAIRARLDELGYELVLRKRGTVRKMSLAHAIKTRNRRGSPGVYVVRDGELALYVGKARKPRHRLWDHVYRSYAGVPQPSDLGLLVIANEPDSLRWRVEITDGEWDDLERIERALLAKLRPCLNRRDNPKPKRLPKKYRRLTKEDLLLEWRRSLE